MMSVLIAALALVLAAAGTSPGAGLPPLRSAASPNVLVIWPTQTQPTTPNFSGTWTLNLRLSDYATRPAPERRTDVIEHGEGTLKVVRRDVVFGRERVAEWSCKTDRTECTNTARDELMRSTAHWSGSTLVVVSKTTYEGERASIEERWTLSQDGRTLTISRSAATDAGAIDQTFVLERPQR